MAKRASRSQFIYIQGILPKTDFLGDKSEKVVRELKAWLIGPASQTLKDGFYETVANWEEKPSFPSEYSEPYNTRMEIYVHPVGKGTTNWQRVSGGTGPRMIVSKKGMMHFKPGYTPKTTPSGQYGGPGRRYGEWKHRWTVGPHRIVPREFSKKIREKHEKKLKQQGEQILAKALK